MRGDPHMNCRAQNTPESALAKKLATSLAGISDAVSPILPSLSPSTPDTTSKSLQRPPRPPPAPHRGRRTRSPVHFSNDCPSPSQPPPSPVRASSPHSTQHRPFVAQAGPVSSYITMPTQRLRLASRGPSAPPRRSFLNSGFDANDGRER